MTDNDPLQVAAQAARAAGGIALDAYRNARTIRAKGVNDLVTEVDDAAEEAIVTRLLAAFPADGVLAEERGALSGASQYVWVIDPLDGTHNYAAQLPFWCVSVARFNRDLGQPDVAAIYDPLHDEIYTALAGGGAWLNGQRISVSKVDGLQSSIIACDLGYDELLNARTLVATLLVGTKVRRLRVLGSAVLALAYVACGRLDAFYHTHLQPWDLAAGWLLLTEARGKCSLWSGAEISLEHAELVASNALLHEALLETLSAEAPRG